MYFTMIHFGLAIAGTPSLSIQLSFYTYCRVANLARAVKFSSRMAVSHQVPFFIAEINRSRQRQFSGHHECLIREETLLVFLEYGISQNALWRAFSEYDLKLVEYGKKPCAPVEYEKSTYCCSDRFTKIFHTYTHLCIR